MSNELKTAIRAVANEVPTVKELTALEASRLTDRVAQEFVADPNRIWWWEALKVPSRTLNYGEEAGLEKIASMLDPASVVTMLVTDDNPPPWPAFKGPLSEILHVIGEQWFFEYLLVGEAGDWCIFDTHHNSLVIAGSLIEREATRS